MKRVDALFDFIGRANGPTWGHVLDSGTGEHSLGWLATLPAKSLTAVTVESWRMGGLHALAEAAAVAAGHGTTPIDLHLGQWTDPTMLHGRVFDQVLVDYVIGAIDGHAPYFQYDFLRRLRPHCGGRVYLIGLEPPPRDGSVLDEVCRVRDACILLAGHRMYREYPREVVCDWLGRAGYRVVDARSFANKLGARFVNGQLDVATRKLPLFRDRAVAEAMGAHIEELRGRALDRGEQTWGEDWVIVAEAVEGEGA